MTNGRFPGDSRASRVTRVHSRVRASSREFAPATNRTRNRRERSVAAVPARTGTTCSSRIALLSGVVRTPRTTERRLPIRPCAGATAVAVGRHPRDYIDPWGAPFSAPFRRGSFSANHPERDPHDNGPRPLLPDSNVFLSTTRCTRCAYSVAQLRPVDHMESKERTKKNGEKKGRASMSDSMTIMRKIYLRYNDFRTLSPRNV